MLTRMLACTRACTLAARDLLPDGASYDATSCHMQPPIPPDAFPNSRRSLDS
jgi:hypothetical protein